MIKIIEYYRFRDIKYYILMEYISTIIKFKKYIKSVLEGVDSGEFDEEEVKRLADNAEIFMANNKKDDVVLKPRAIESIMDDISDTSSETTEQEPNFLDDDIDDMLASILKPKEEVKPVYKDNLVSEFLNNEMVLDKYHYLKNDRYDIDKFYKSCYTY